MLIIFGYIFIVAVWIATTVFCATAKQNSDRLKEKEKEVTEQQVALHIQPVVINNQQLVAPTENKPTEEKLPQNVNEEKPTPPESKRSDEKGRRSKKLKSKEKKDEKEEKDEKEKVVICKALSAKPCSPNVKNVKTISSNVRSSKKSEMSHASREIKCDGETSARSNDRERVLKFSGKLKRKPIRSTDSTQSSSKADDNPKKVDPSLNKPIE